MKKPKEEKCGLTVRQRGLEILFVLILALYPLRHITWGLDLWDTGYNYANFEYMGLEHMDPMWLFSTYLANAVGHILTMLPFAGNLVGMNFYTGLFVSILAAAGYWFCTRKLLIPPGIAFAGEMAAVSLCWCPTALLYNYLTYLLFLGCVILLYQGLSGNKKICLYGAGLCLGANVLVRFSNLPQAALIVAVWAYGAVEALEKRSRKDKGESGGQTENGGNGPGVLKRTAGRTLWCLGGYLTTLSVLFGYIHVRYGMNAYIEGIGRLFAMTENASDYKAASMITTLLYTYMENLYWVFRLIFIVFVGTALFAAAEWAVFHISGGEEKVREKICRMLRGCVRLLWCAAAAAVPVWLYVRGFCSLEFYSYGSMLRPGILFLMLTMGIAAICIFRRGSSKEEKLISGLLILVVLITSVGSNNNVYPSLNNLFVAAPYTFWQCYRFIRYVGDFRRNGIVICSFPAKGVLAAFLALFMVQSTLFGVCFVFAEATGVQDISAGTGNNDILRGIRMSPERAEWMRSLSDYVEEHDLKGHEVILYGGVPSLSYYLQMPSAFNPWSDLDSYGLDIMEQDLYEVEERMRSDASYRPAIILEKEYAQCLENGSNVPDLEKEGKWRLLTTFMENNGYEKTFRNEKFAIWE